MPQINIPTTYDASMIADMANLGGAYGLVHVDADTMGFTFQAAYMDAVDQAIRDYPSEWFAQYKLKKLDDLAKERAIHELRGPMGISLTDKTILRLSIKRADLEWHPEKTGVRWEISRGNFAWLDRATIIAIADSSVNHVEACFENVYQITAAIDEVVLDVEAEDPVAEVARVKAELDAITLTEGWPTWS